jgi:thioredoxin reductase (NADPH)
MAEIKLYGAPWCPDCKRSKKFLAEHRVPFDWIDIDQDAAARAYVEELQNGGRSIPTIVFPDESVLVEPADDELARKLGMKLEASRSFYEVAIVGGGPTGLAAALYAAREGIDAVVIDKSALGGQAGITERIENYPGFPEGVGGAELMERFVAQARRYGVELVPAVEVGALETEGKNIVLRLRNGQEICAHSAIIATGSRYRRLSVPGEGDLIGAGVHFCATCDGPFYRGAEELLVVGGGNSGLEEGLYLSKFARRIRIVEFQPTLKASKILQDEVRRRPEFVVHTNTEIVEFRGKHKLREVVARDRATGEEHVWRPAAAFVFIGLDPNTAFLKGTLELDRWGFVVTDARFQTSLPGVYAAGDVRQGSTKQLGSAVGEGIAAILQVREYLQRSRQLAAAGVNE